MTAWVKCPSCGARNELLVDRLYCNRCSAPLDLSHVRFGASRSVSIGRFVKRLVRMLVLALLLVVLVLLLWPTTPQGTAGTREDAEACFEKLAELYDAIEAGHRLQRILTEAEVNGYLDALLEGAVPDPEVRDTALNMRAINLSFTEEAFVVHILAEWNVLRLSYEIEGQPRLQDGQFGVDVLRVSLGHLPMPGPMKQRFAKRLLPLFEQLEQERYVLDNLTQINLGEARIRLIAGR